MNKQSKPDGKTNGKTTFWSNPISRAPVDWKALNF
jgi:hypothetical protein